MVPAPMTEPPMLTLDPDFFHADHLELCHEQGICPCCGVELEWCACEADAEVERELEAHPVGCACCIHLEDETMNEALADELDNAIRMLRGTIPAACPVDETPEQFRRRQAVGFAACAMERAARELRGQTAAYAAEMNDLFARFDAMVG